MVGRGCRRDIAPYWRHQATAMEFGAQIAVLITQRKLCGDNSDTAQVSMCNFTLQKIVWAAPVAAVKGVGKPLPSLVASDRRIGGPGV
mmetsp:Transcript_27503/g.72287  ORF Transcript_27503/g.72287 Transcript_27503/m.72287 type:complete len:88 (-) Transcript_27503:3016-3279(-)